MRISTSLLCLAASLAAAPAFAQGTAQPAGKSQPLSQSARAGEKMEKPAQTSPFNFGLGLNKGASERSLLAVGPISKDELELSWKPASNWDVTLDLTTRSRNALPTQLFPREEVTAGVTYQVTPRFRLGGGVTVKGDSVAESLSDPASRFGKEGSEASVRIESAFSF
ncbi:MAG: hypothetical protein RIR33_2809 [Pseudomonadota bacterium]